MSFSLFKAARENILAKMAKTISKPRTDRKENHPVVKDLVVPIEQRGKLIGSGGLNIKRIRENTGVQLTSKDETSFKLFAPNEKALAEAEEIINTLLTAAREPQLDFGGVYTAKIVEIRDSGLMVQFYPTMRPALLPNSQLDGKKVNFYTR